MSITSIGNNVVAPLSLAEQKQNLSKLSELQGKLEAIKNSMADIEKSNLRLQRFVDTGQPILKSIRSISEKHGENASVRLKGDHFKYGEASNVFKKMFHGGRYQTERQAAVKIINDVIGSKGNAISAGEVLPKIKESVDIALAKIAEGKRELISLTKKENNTEGKINNINKILSETKKAEEQSRKDRKNFSMIYQSNAGCKAINAAARHLYANGNPARAVRGSDIVSEYCKVHGDDIFKGNKDLKLAIEVNSKDLKELVKKGAEALYTPTRENIVTYRGQGIRYGGIDSLLTQFKDDQKNGMVTVYKPGQFFSTSKDEPVARHFANKSQDPVEVIFKVKGNSSGHLLIPGGLAFENKESERLYSPLANFKVTDILKDNTPANRYFVELQEVKQTKNAKILPYE